MRHWIFSFFCLILFALGCEAPTPDKYTEDKALYEQAIKLFEDKQYTESISFFESLKNRFPDSPYRIDSELKIADAYFEKGEYFEAEIHYQTFRSLHPTHPKIPHVVFRRGLSHYERIPGGIDRDQTQTKHALNTFKELLRRWPGSSQAKESETYLEKCKLALAQRDLYVAGFYLKQNQYEAALQRLQAVRGNTDFHKLRAEAAYKLGYAYYKLKNPKSARKALEEVLQNPEAGKYRKKAKKLLGELRF